MIANIISRYKYQKKNNRILHPNDSIHSSSHECILSEAVARVLGASQSAPVIQQIIIKWNDSIACYTSQNLKYLQKASSQHNLQIHLLAIHSLPKRNTKQVSLTKHLKNPKKNEVLNTQGSSQDKASDTLQCQMCREPHVILAKLQFSANFPQICHV